jgi:LysW-gamma-L-alpha-aminoadipyl-6-phosphate/LysW-L-glutamyl-5-phosphate reductase
MSNGITCAIIGAAGYGGGELLRLSCLHPLLKPVFATSRSRMGQQIHAAHPNLRGHLDLAFCSPDQVGEVDAIFLCLPHGESAKQLPRWKDKARWIVDLSADFRLKDPDLHRLHYGEEPPLPDLRSSFAYGLPETTREEIRGSNWVSGVGCNATAVSLALLPLVKEGLLDLSQPIIADVKVGSSEGGAESSEASHHPERSGAVRPYAPVTHRHEAEVVQMFRRLNSPQDPRLYMTVTSIEMVRGAAASVHCFLNCPLTEKDLWGAFRKTAQAEPFLRIVKSSTGNYRLPEPKVVAGTNFADLGFALHRDKTKVTLFCSIDNLVKGAAGSAIQCLNLMVGEEETLGLTSPGLHP